VNAGVRRSLDLLASPRGTYALGLLREADADERGRLCAGLAPHLTGVVMDAESASAAILAGSLPGRCGLAVDLTAGDAGRPHLAAGCSPAAVRRLGASACYLRVPLRGDRPGDVRRSLRLARVASGLCHGEGVALVLHVSVPRLAGESAAVHAERRSQQAAAASRELADVDADLVVAPLACGARLRRRWICELDGETPDELEDSVVRACRTGARGFAIGAPLLGGVLDEAAMLDSAVPLATGLRELAEEAIAAVA
jgi:hypothetical protein